MSETKQSTAVAAPSPRPVVMVEHTQALFDTARFEQFQRVASALKYASILAESIRGQSPEECFSNLMIVCEMAERWQMSPASLAQSISIVHNKVVVEGKAIQAALDATLGIELYPWWTGERGTDQYRIFLSDQPWEDLEEEVLASLKPGVQMKGRKIVDGSVGEWKTSYKNRQGNWTDNAAWVGAASQDQLLYRATRQWTRRYKPALIMGVYAADEIEAIDDRRDRREAINAPVVTAGFSAKAEPAVEEKVEDAVVEEIATGEGDHVTDAGKMIEDEETRFPTGKDRVSILNAAFVAGRNGLSFPVNMAWGEELIGEIDAAIERGRVQRGGDLEDKILGAVLKGEIPSYENVPDADLDKVKAFVKAAHMFRERIIGAAKEGNVVDGIDLDDPDPIVIEVAGFGDVTLPNPAVDELFEEAERLIQAFDDEADKPKGNPKQKKDVIEEGEGKAPAVEEESEGEDLTDAGDDADPWKVRLESCSSWVEVKTAFVQLTKTEQWSSFDEEEQNRLRGITWGRQQEINDSGAESLDMISDFTAFRCWIEYSEDADAIDGNWQALCGGEAWENAAMKIRDALVPAVRERLRGLR